MKKFFIVVCIVYIGLFSISYAFNEFSYEKAKGLAEEYIDNSLVGDDNWKETHPTIAGEGKYFYTDSDSPSYVEFKVSCDTTPDCGFIMVNFDGDDVSIPVASTSGNTPSEILIAQNGGSSDDNKLYYFNPFEQYSENTKNGEVSSIDPKDNIENSLKEDTKSTDKEKKQKRKDSKKKLKDRLDTNKKEAGAYKKTDDFKQKRKNLKDKKLTIPKDEIGMKILPFAMADTGNSGNTGYTPPTASNTFIAGSSTTNCGSRVPCYTQYYLPYNPPVPAAPSTCASGCSPTALAMVYGYYDRQGTYPNLVTGTAIDYFTQSSPDSNIKTMVESLKTQMGTNCVYNSSYNVYEGQTSANNIPLGIQYAKNKGYVNSSSVYSGTQTVSTIFTKVKSEINAGRPIILNSTKHSMVAYGYNNTANSNIVRLNMGWGKDASVVGTNGTTYKYSNIDYNMASIYYSNANQPSISSYVTILIN